MWLSVPAALAGLAVELMLGQLGIVSASGPEGAEGEAGGDGGDQGDGDHVFFNRALLNTVFFVADYVFVHGITSALKETDVNVARQKLLSDMAPTTNDLSEFTFGFAKAIFQKYINPDELVMTIVAKIEDAPNIDDVRLPHYVETPGLRNS
jgi:hypothetical protein